MLSLLILFFIFLEHDNFFVFDDFLESMGKIDTITSATSTAPEEKRAKMAVKTVERAKMAMKTVERAKMAVKTV